MIAATITFYAHERHNHHQLNVTIIINALRGCRAGRRAS
jgi:hypothetical protein